LSGALESGSKTAEKSAWLVKSAPEDYVVEFGEHKLSGLVHSEQLFAVGAEVLLQFAGYKNSVAIFNAGFGAGPRRK